MADRDVELNLNARDNASDVVEGVADQVDRLPDEKTVEVDADAKDAARSLDTFEKQVDGLTDDARELRVTFRAEQLQREIRSALRDLERLDDPVEIDARTRDLERAQGELRDLSELADRKYTIDIDADPKRTAQRAAGDIESMRSRGEGLQSAIPAIRGFGDELGGAAQGAGIASQAVADLGDFALISGERFAAEGSRMQGVATKLGTVLGAAGLAGAIAGIGVQLTQTLIPKIQEWIGSADDAVEANDELRGSFEGVGDAIAAGEYRQATDEFLSSNDELVNSAREVGVSSEDLARYVLKLQSDLGDTSGIDTQSEAYRQLEADAKLARSEVEREAADRIHFDRLAIEVGDELLAKRQQQLTAEGRYTEAMRLGSDAAEDNTSATGDAADATDDLTDAEEAAVEAIRAVTDAQLEQAGAHRSAADAGLAVTAATDAWNATLWENTIAVDDADAGTAAYNELLADTIDAAAGLADATVAENQALADAAGKTYAQSQATSDWNREMVAAARQASGPLQQAIIDYVAEVNGIPPEKVSDIVADTDYASVDEAAGALDDVSETRRAQITAEALTAAAEGELNATARDRTSTIYGDVEIRRNVRWDQGSGTFVPTSLSAPLAPEPAPAAKSASARSAIAPASSGLYASNGYSVNGQPVAASGGVTNNVTVNVPRATDPRQLVATLNRWTRINGRP